MDQIKKFLPLYGKWDIKTDGSATFEHGDTSAGASHGLVLSSHSLSDGAIECDVSLTDVTKGGASIVFRANGQSQFYAAGIGGWENAFSLFQSTNMSFTRLSGVGALTNLESNKIYKLRVQLEGQRVDVLVDGVKLITYSGVLSNEANSVGIFCFNSTSRAIFQNIRTTSSRPKAFVAMQFSDPYSEVYRDAVAPLVAEIGFEPLRIDDVHSPGIIINDILSNLEEASIVIAEVSERNANVYYELGIAHALGKPTVLMASKGTSLPFDVGPHRCIFYENTIAGRARLQEALKKALSTILKREVS